MKWTLQVDWTQFLFGWEYYGSAFTDRGFDIHFGPVVIAVFPGTGRTRH